MIFSAACFVASFRLEAMVWFVAKSDNFFPGVDGLKLHPRIR